MESKFIEVENGGNWAKLLIGQWTDDELAYSSVVAEREPLLDRVQGNLRRGRAAGLVNELAFAVMTPGSCADTT